MPGEQKKYVLMFRISTEQAVPDGCESVSTVMLRFLGIDITVDEFIENIWKRSL